MDSRHNCSASLEYMEGKLVGCPLGQSNNAGHLFKAVSASLNNWDSGNAHFVFLKAQESIFHFIASAISHPATQPRNAQAAHQIVPPTIAQAPCHANLAKYFPILPHLITFPTPIDFR